MPRPPRGTRLGGSPAHHRRMMANLAASVISEERITTTHIRARSVRPLLERLITRARKGDLHSRRIVLKTIQNTEVVTKLFDEVAPRYTHRPGGYIRIVKLGPRRGDGAEMAVIELV